MGANYPVLHVPGNNHRAAEIVTARSQTGCASHDSLHADRKRNAGSPSGLESRPVPAAYAAAPKSRNAPTPTVGETQSITSSTAWQFAPAIPRQFGLLPLRIQSLVP